METLYVDECIRISYDPDTGVMFCSWTGHQSMETIEKAGAVILDIVRKRTITRILNDNTQVIGPWHEASEWTHEVWFPAVIKAGLKHFAWVFSKNTFARLSARKAMPQSNGVRDFNSYDEALKWLQTLR